MGKSGGAGGTHGQHSMILVPRRAKGVTIVRPFGHIHDHAEIVFDDVRVPVTNMILGEGRGFEVAQGRLGPGRIHHCMRTIGAAEQGLDAIVHRAHNRTAFGKLLANQATIRQSIAEARIDMTKVDAPRMCLKIIDEAIQVHGAHGVSQDSQLSDMYHHVRHVRLADGPDIVHLNTIAKEELKKKTSVMGEMVSGKNKNIEKYGKFAHVVPRIKAKM